MPLQPHPIFCVAAVAAASKTRSIDFKLAGSYCSYAKNRVQLQRQLAGSYGSYT
jgi:hypothetical protein